MEIKEPFKVDKKGLVYLDSRDIKIDKLCFQEIKKSYYKKRDFYTIDGIDNYIIKDSTMEPLVFNVVRNKKLLENLVSKQEKIPEVEFPIGYYKNLGSMKGFIIPYYKDSISLRKIMYLHEFSDLTKFYNHSSDEVDNLICLLLNILELISKMYNNGVTYMDVHGGNFVFKDNEIKVIDFDPGYVFFDEKDKKHFTLMLNNYLTLVEKVCRKLGFKDILLNNCETFMETENKVKSLKKQLER